MTRPGLAAPVMPYAGFRLFTLTDNLLEVLRPGTICTFFVSGLKIADLKRGYDSERWPPLWADFAVDWRAEWFGRQVEPPTWYMADDVVAAGLDGILFPRRRTRAEPTW